MKRKNTIEMMLWIMLVAMLLISCNTKSVAQHIKYYVSLDGNDSNSGNSNAPFRTIKKGVSVLSSGDTLLVRSGNYGNELSIDITKSGTKENPIVITAEEAGTVFLKGLRKKGAEDYTGKDEGIVFNVLNSSYVIIDGFHISDFSVGVNVLGSTKHSNNIAHNVIVKNCIFVNNGEVGVQTARADSTLVTGCQFISDLVQKEGYIVSIQDYGCNFYNTTYSIVEDCYFYGAHHQSVSFKEGNKDCIARKNIFEGAQYTAIYLGQNRRADASPENDNPTCENLIAEYNIVRPAKGYRVKSPLRIDNCKNAIVRCNYFEGFDETNNTGGINVWNESLGKIDIYNNILAFSQNNIHSCGVSLELESNVEVLIHNNTFYKVVQDLCLDRYRGDDSETFKFEKNISYKCKYNSKVDKNNFKGNPVFINGNPIKQPIADTPKKPIFNEYYKKLTEPFRLKKNSKAQGFGVDFKNCKFDSEKK